jgi:hypothetical protein
MKRSVAGKHEEENARWCSVDRGAAGKHEEGNAKGKPSA